MNQQHFQLEINFDDIKHNTFRTQLDNAEFRIIVELPIPSADTPINDAARKYADFANFIANQNNPGAQIAFVSNNLPSASVDPVSFAAKLCPDNRDSHIIYLNGAGQSVRDLMDLIGHAWSEGFRNFCASTGIPPVGTSEDDTRAIQFAEPACLLRSLRDSSHPACVGTVVNPYQYTPESACAQSFKMFRDIANGASFVSARFGWDAAKLRELACSLSNAEVNVPIIAGIAVLTPENTENVCAGKIPGLHVSPDFIAMLRKDRAHSFTQFQAAQLRHIQLHAAGAKLLGFNAIQLSGTTNVEFLSLIFKRIREALNEFRSIDDWKDAYFDYYDQISMAPYPHNFYLFKNLLNRNAPVTEPVPVTPDIPAPSHFDSFTRKFASILCKHADAIDPQEHHFTKKLLVHCRSCSACSLPKTDFVCPHNCPMNLINGSCGLNNADGSCFITGNDCTFAKRIRFAALSDDFTSLTEGCFDPSHPSVPQGAPATQPPQQ